MQAAFNAGVADLRMVALPFRGWMGGMASWGADPP